MTSKKIWETEKFKKNIVKGIAFALLSCIITSTIGYSIDRISGEYPLWLLLSLIFCIVLTPIYIAIFNRKKDRQTGVKIVIFIVILNSIIFGILSILVTYKESPFLGLFSFFSLMGLNAIPIPLILFSENKLPNGWKKYKSGWGIKIPGGSDNEKEHISVTNYKARVGKGFHITVGDNHLYFDNKGNYLGEGGEAYSILEKLASMLNRGLITEKEYDDTLKRLSEIKKKEGIEF